MSDIYHRAAYVSFRRGQWKHLPIIIVAILGASALWRAADEHLIYRLGCSSVGCRWRRPLTQAALLWRNPKLPEGIWTVGHTLPRPGWLMLSWAGETLSIRRGVHTRRSWSAVANQHLDLKGTFVSLYTLSAPPEDIDGDRRLEVVLYCHPYGLEKADDLSHWAVLRLGQDVNELICVAQLDPKPWSAKMIRVKPIWKDEDQDGQGELTLVTMKISRKPDGRLRFDPPRTVAVFGWTEPGGVLVPQKLPPDGSITFWQPPDGKPMVIEQQADLSDVLRKLMPKPTTRPATQTAPTPKSAR